MTKYTSHLSEEDLTPIPEPKPIHPYREARNLVNKKIRAYMREVRESDDINYIKAKVERIVKLKIISETLTEDIEQRNL